MPNVQAEFFTFAKIQLNECLTRWSDKLIGKREARM
jgi:hypothetical protein